MTYDGNGHAVSFLSELDDNGDGKLSSRITGTLTYSSHGELLEQVFETDAAELPGGEIDGIIDYRQTGTFEYDADGNVVLSMSTVQQTGFPAVTETTRQTYDSRGNVLSYQSEVDFNGDGTIDARVGAVNTYNSRGQLVTSTSESDFDGDGTIDYRSVATTTYDGVKH